MVQRKVPSKLGIQADHVKSDKHLANLKLSSSQHQDGKSRGADMKKKMKKSRSIKLYDLEALQTSSSPSRKSLPQLGKSPPLHVLTTAASTSASTSPQKQHPVVRIIDGSPNYMKPTSSSHAKKELFPVSLRNTQSSSDFKNLPRKFSSDSKARSVSNKKATKTLTRSSSMSLVMTLTKTTSFKASRSCPRKSTRASMCAADMSTPQRATCSSTLKESKFPPYLMLNPGGTESEGTSTMKVCPYNYCSLNGHHHAALLPLKSFMSARRRLLKTQKSMKLVEALSPQKLKVPCEMEEEKSDTEKNLFDEKEKPACDEIGMDFFIEIYGKEKETRQTGADEMGKIDFRQEIEDQEDIKSTIEDDVKQVSPTVPDTPSKFEIDLEEENFKMSLDDVAIEEQNAGDSDLNNNSSWFHEEISMGSYCSDEASYDGEHMEDVGMDHGSDSKATDMEWEEEEFREFDCEEDADSAVFIEEDTDSKVESLSESSHDVSVIWLDDMQSSYYEDILAEEELQEANVEESNCFEDQPHGISFVLEGTSGNTDTQETGYSSGISCDQCSLTEDNGGENVKHVHDEAICNVKVLDEEKNGNGQCPKMSETCKIDETGEDRNSSLENNDESIGEGNRVRLFDVQDESTIAVEEQELLAKDQGKAKKFQSTSSTGGEERDTIKNWKGPNWHKRPVEDDEEMRKFNPREPNFLPLVPEPEPEKVDLKHQMIDERKNAEDWMIDCALRQVVTKLDPARKKKVALLVEAFETVMPIPKCDTHMRNNSAFAHAGRIQACS